MRQCHFASYGYVRQGSIDQQGYLTVGHDNSAAHSVIAEGVR